MDKYIRKLTAVILFAVIISVLVLSFVTGKNDNEKRTARPRTTLSSIYDGSYFAELMKNTSDNIAFRDKMMRFHAMLNVKFGGNTVNGVYIDKERLLDAEMSEREADPTIADRINAFARKYDGTLYIAAIPSSSGVYGDIMPDYLLSDPESQQISRLYDALDNGIRRIDAYNILKMLKDNYIYFRNDTKWTSYGAYCIYRTVIQKLGFLPTPYDKYTIRHVTDDFRGNLYSRTLYSDTMADILDIYEYPDGAKIESCSAVYKNGLAYEKEFYDMGKLDSDYMYNMYLGDPEAVIEIETSVNNERKLLVIKDSYADCFIPFLTQHYSRITVVSPQYMKDPLSEHIDISDYQQTLLLFGIENSGDSSLFSEILK